jgi:hypothetical protein
MAASRAIFKPREFKPREFKAPELVAAAAF